MTERTYDTPALILDTDHEPLRDPVFEFVAQIEEELDVPLGLIRATRTTRITGTITLKRRSP